jgi:hypothetical protein
MDSKKRTPKSVKKQKPHTAARTKFPNTHVIPKTAQQYSRMTASSQEKWNRVVHVISKMRSHQVSLTSASKEVGIDPRTVTKLCQSALKKNSNGRFATKPKDRMLRILVIPGLGGLTEVAVNDSRQASLIGKYSDALQKYLRTGNASGLNEFSRRGFIDASGKTVRFLTDLDQLNRQASAGVLSFESLYARSS